MECRIVTGPEMLRFIVLLTVLLAVVPPAAAQEDVLLARGDSAQVALDPRSAMKYYQAAEKLQPENPEVLWRISKLHTDFAAGETTDAVALRHLDHAIDYANRAITADPRHSMAQAALAIAFGQKAVVASNTDKVELSRLVRKHAIKALEFERDNHVAMLVLGIWNREVAELSWVVKLALDVVYGGLPEASLEESRRLLQRAAQLYPDQIMPHVELAKTLKAMDDETGAKRHLRKALSLPKRDIGDTRRIEEARKLLQELT
jgi:tetratricopeptide (TPR) repeat protein